MIAALLPTLTLVLSLLPSTRARATQDPAGFPGLAAGRAPQVEIAWNRLYDDAEIYALLDRLAARWPELLSYEVIGHSVESRELRVYTLNNPATGPDASKPAMWIDGNVHGNEVQGSEAVVYAAWYLLENYGTQPARDRAGRPQRLLPAADGQPRRARLLVPRRPQRAAPRARAPARGRRRRRPASTRIRPTTSTATAASCRCASTCRARARYRLSADDPRVLEPVPATVDGGRGDWILLGSEGIDDDGDGRVNEDGAGGYDMNRAWPSLLAARARAVRRRRLPALLARDARHRALHPGAPQHRRRAVLPQRRRHDPARPGRRELRRVPARRRARSTTSSAATASACCRSTATWSSGRTSTRSTAAS